MISNKKAAEDGVPHVASNLFPSCYSTLPFDHLETAIDGISLEMLS